ncbi:MAG: GNAT family N-acetyltransferase [Amaricoccus sp.]
MDDAIYAALQATWPAAEVRRLGPWTLRRGEGGGNRTEAASLEGPLADIEVAEAAMRAWNQRPLFILRPGEDALDAALAERGYGVPDRNRIYAARAAELAAPGELNAIPCVAPLAAMVEIWAEGDIGAAKLAVMARAPARRTYLLGRLDDCPAGCAFVAAHAGVAMLSALHVTPGARRRGLAGHLLRAAAAWAGQAGAGTLALAVKGDNAPARALYERLGMAEFGGYHYRAAP